MKPKDKNENAKNSDWKIPMEMPGAKPGAYDASMGAPGGTNEDMLKTPPKAVDKKTSEKI